MAPPPAKGKGPAAKGGKPKGKSASKKSACYEISGSSLKRKNRNCPKCGPGVFMAGHKDRWTCGKCGYMEKRAS
jgi:ubiquitin-small subunit ribosomal protein S27Ae